MDDVTGIIFLVFIAILFIANEIFLWKKKQARKIEHRVFDVTYYDDKGNPHRGKDQIWLRAGKVIKIISHDRLIWTECYPGVVRPLDGGGVVVNE